MNLTEISSEKKVLNEQQRKSANQKTTEILLEAQKEIGKEQIKQTYNVLKWMIVFAFITGIGLMVASGVMLIIRGQENWTQTLTSGLLGIGIELFIVIIYLPMDRLQKASADLTQHKVVLKTWSIFVNVKLLAMDINNMESVNETTKSIFESTTTIIKAIETYIEDSFTRKSLELIKEQSQLLKENVEDLDKDTTDKEVVKTKLLSNINTIQSNIQAISEKKE
jgi:hypothetical protein